MTKNIEFNPQKEFINSVELNINYWIDKKSDTPMIDHPNLRQAVLYGCRYRETIKLALSLLRKSMPLIEIRGDFMEWLEVINRLKKFDKTIEKKDQCFLHIIKGNLEYRNNLFAKAIRNYQFARDFGEEINNKEIIISSTIGLCLSNWGNRNFESAKSYGEELMQGEETENIYIDKMGIINNILGMIYLSENDLGNAGEYFQKARKYFTKNKDPRGEMRVENNLARIDTAKGNNKSALKRLNRAENYFNINEYDIDLLKIRVSKGFLYYRMGELISARKILSNAIPADWENSSTKHNVAWRDFILGALELAQKNKTKSRQFFIKSLNYWQETNNTEMVLITEKAITGIED